uniref:Uncharacterized protein n=1 Tax=Phasianus colchicus TaxID=9054 RepID=A0A669QQL1_PHACC
MQSGLWAEFSYYGDNETSTREQAHQVPSSVLYKLHHDHHYQETPQPIDCRNKVISKQTANHSSMTRLQKLPPTVLWQHCSNWTPVDQSIVTTTNTVVQDDQLLWRALCHPVITCYYDIDTVPQTRCLQFTGKETNVLIHLL